MRRALVLVAAALTAWGCTPRAVFEAIAPLAFPQCNEKRDACPPAGEVSPVDSETPDTTHWTRGPHWGPPSDTASLVKLPRDSTRR